MSKAHQWSEAQPASSGGLRANASHRSKERTTRSSYKAASGGTYGFVDAIL